jgi:hypothetical protein
MATPANGANAIPLIFSLFSLLRLRGVAGTQHAYAFQGRLLNAVDRLWVVVYPQHCKWVRIQHDRIPPIE